MQCLDEQQFHLALWTRYREDPILLWQWWPGLRKGFYDRIQ